MHLKETQTESMIEFAVQHLTIFDACLAAVVIAGLLIRHRHATFVWWAVWSVSTVLLTFVLSRASVLVYSDPRADTPIHIKAIAPFAPFFPHDAHSSFPSSHAILAAVIVFSVLFLSRRWTIPFLILGLLDMWARVGTDPHQLIDIVGGWLIVSLSAAITFVFAAIVTAVILPALPPRWTAERLRLRTARHFFHLA